MRPLPNNARCASPAMVDGGLGRSAAKLRVVTGAAFLSGLAAGAIELAYLRKVEPLQADLGIQLAVLFLALLLVLAVAAFLRREPKAWISLIPLPLALIGPMLLGLLIVGCAVNTGNCP